jgi:hypothetical protein
MVKFDAGPGAEGMRPSIQAVKLLELVLNGQINMGIMGNAVKVIDFGLA